LRGRGRARRQGGHVPLLLVLARRGAGARRAPRRGGGHDGGAPGARQRCGSLRGGDRPRDPRVPRQFSAGARPPGARQRGGRVRAPGEVVSLAGALVGGALGTVVLTTALTVASELRVTRMDIPFLLGTAVSANRTRARVI